MGRGRLFMVLLGALVAVLSLVAGAGGANGHANYRAVCPSPPAGYAHCHALVVTDSRGNPQASSSPTGLDPSQIASAYGWSSTLNAGTSTIAIVDAYDDPTAASDLNTFSHQYGLPLCDSSNPCFTKVNQTGGTSSYPRKSADWALEISLDIEWAHAIAPNAKILLVEASSSSFADLMAAEDYAKAHAQYVSNSWGGSEFSGESSYDSHFLASGVSFFVSAGDSGGTSAEYPSASPNVISVGGTTLHFDNNGAFSSETGWSSGGGGCSAYENATAAQASFAGYGQVNCGGKRATPDVSLDADPASGVSVYDSTKYQGQSGWFTVGGTSASSPMWAARSADAGVTVNSAYVYGSSIGFRDITSGSNGNPCLVGYDLCAGRGSWADGTATTQPPAQASISFTTKAQTLTVGQPSGAITIQLSPSASSSVDVTVKSSSGSGSFSTSGQSGPFSTGPLTLSGVSSTATFYYEDGKAGSPTLTASASGYASATQTETVNDVAGAPAAPTGLSASAHGKHISLSWQPSSGATSYNLWRGTASGKEVLYASGLTGTSANDMAVSSGVTYYYQVAAVGPGGTSGLSKEVAATAK